MLPKKCLLSCEVPHLCMIACPLNDQLEQLSTSSENNDDVLNDPDESLDIEVANESKASADDAQPTL